MQIRSSHCADFGGVEVLRPGELDRPQVKQIRLASPHFGSLTAVCLHDEPVGKEDQFVPRLRAGIRVPRAAFIGCLEKAERPRSGSGADVRRL